MPTRNGRLYLLDKISGFQTANMNSKVLQKLKEVQGRLLTLEHNQIKHQLEIDIYSIN